MYECVQLEIVSVLDNVISHRTTQQDTERKEEGWSQYKRHVTYILKEVPDAMLDNFNPPVIEFPCLCYRLENRV